MGAAKEISLRPIDSATANALVKRVHYSGKVVNNSQFHVGVLYRGRLEGAMQFGPSLDKRKLQGLVADTPWNGFIELNRMAFSDVLPRNSESRAIGIAMRLLRKHAPHLQWVVSFADGAQCGDGTIYRASGFVLTGIRPNNQIWTAATGETISRTTMTKGGNNNATGAASMKAYAAAGFRPIPGFQLRYFYFLDPTARQRLTAPILPFSEIERLGAGMYKGKPRTRTGSIDGDAAGPQPEQGGSTPTPVLSLDAAN